jgi:hypothetical protein
MRYLLALSGLTLLAIASTDPVVNGLDLLAWVLFGSGVYLILRTRRPPHRR